MDLVHASAKTPLAVQGQLLEKGWLARAWALKWGNIVLVLSWQSFKCAVRQSKHLDSQVLLTFLQVI